ncbi:MAG: phage tail protein [Bacteroidota bacterium]
MSYYPPVGFHFHVEFVDIGGGNDGRFQEVSGISAELTTTSVKEGGENRFTYELPERANYTTLTLKRGMLIGSDVANWCRKAIEELDIETTEVLVTLLNENHEPLQTYAFFNCWPKKWSISNFNAEAGGSSAIVIETLELAHHGFRVL